jgi:hypothetical protein
MKTQLEIAIENLDEALDSFDSEVDKIKSLVASSLIYLREYKHYEERNE